MMGTAIASLDASIVKGSCGLLTFNSTETARPREFSCIRCGRCQENCPAKLTGKQLNPKQVIQDVKAHMEQVYKLRGKAGEDGDDGRPAFQGEVIKPEVLWACTTCRACVRLSRAVCRALSR